VVEDRLSPSSSLVAVTGIFPPFFLTSSMFQPRPSHPYHRIPTTGEFSSLHLVHVPVAIGRDVLYSPSGRSFHSLMRHNFSRQQSRDGVSFLAILRQSFPPT